MSSCIVFGCKSGYKTKANEGKKWHMFYPPKNDPDLFATWEQLCRSKGQKLSAKHRVCHKHFPDDMLITQRNIPLQDGCVYHSKLEYWRLKPGAFPCIFDGCGPGTNQKRNSRGGYRSAEGTETTGQPSEKRRCKKSVCANAIGEAEQDPASSTASEIVEEMCGYRADEEIEESPPANAAVGTQTEMDWFVVRDMESKNLNSKRAVLQERAKVPNGVFVPFTGLTGREKKYLLSIARKSSLQTEEGSADHTYHGNS